MKIDKNIKLIEKRNGHKEAKYPFDILKVKESFAVSEPYDSDLHRNLESLSRYYEKKLKVSFVVRKDEYGQLRIWRTK